MKLYYCETLNPRKACAVARHLQVPLEFVRVDLTQGDQRQPDFLTMNPNGKVPLLEENGNLLWESNAIMCRLSQIAGADLWPRDDRQIEVIRWFSWDAVHFTRAAGGLYFEYLIKPHFKMPRSDEAVARATQDFRGVARVLDSHLKDRNYLVGDTLTVADFAVGISLPYAKEAHIPLEEFPHVARWHARLEELPAWREPFPADTPGFGKQTPSAEPRPGYTAFRADAGARA